MKRISERGQVNGGLRAKVAGFRPTWQEHLRYQRLLAQRPWASDARSLKAAVTSREGTTAADLAQFDHEDHGITVLVQRTLEAATSRSRELGSVTYT